ncbi:MULTISPECIES: hypothetical protein [unclassified Pseudomonas]|uniref:hypothetical protein n=1 Tax=unclassified Pseudomonas TaxID=196821 RepID=UPI000A08872E|nr:MULTISPECIES: hypothetical protein [unclassified Pseudomonas]RAS22241.1 hypothetical protein H040_04569 [Pseudomonas sp. URMO17WK12:I7]SMF60539.1 hypothetical protein SAMN02745903_04544 [Pseudomonas sp. URMO17WK12:I5]
MDDWNVRTLSTYLGEPGPKAKQRTDPDPAKTHWLQRVNFVLCDGNMGQADKNGSTSTSQSASSPARKTSPRSHWRPRRRVKSWA